MNQANRLREFAMGICTGATLAFNGLAGRLHVEPLSGTETAALSAGVGVVVVLGWSIARRRLPD